MKRPSDLLRSLGLTLAVTLCVAPWTLAQDLDLSEPESTVVQKATTGDETGELGLSEASGESATESADAFNSLQEAYDWELSQTKTQVKDLQDRVKKMDEQNYRLWKSIRSLSTNPSISLHGFGRSLNYQQKVYGPLMAYPTKHMASETYLDLVPTGIISKELKWDAIIRVTSDLTSGTNSASMDMERISVHLEPSFMSATIGDYDLFWTPFTLINRDIYNDAMYTPGAMERSADYEKDPYFMSEEPYVPLRGLRLGTAVVWPKSAILDSFKVDTFVHQLRSGYSTGYLAFRYSAWMMGAMAELKAKKAFSLGAYGILLDEPLDTDDPAAVYRQYNAATWAQQYRVGSLTPKLELDLNEDVKVGVAGEGAYSLYWDDKQVSARQVTDWALTGGPSLRVKNSTVNLRYLDVGYGFYSPMAQNRQRDDLLGSTAKHPVILSSDIGIDALGRPSALFKYYNRMFDNVFPYGLATPNRKGFGGDMDLRLLDKEALSLKAMVYAVEQVSDNFVVNQAGTSFVSVDGVASAPLPKRDFLYVNVGPKINIASLLDLKRRLDLGVNVRCESTKSDVGTLNSSFIQAGLGVGITRWFETEAAVRVGNSKGRESAIGGQFARSTYLYDNGDLGDYAVTDIDYSYSFGCLSFAFAIDRHSKLWVDAALMNESSLYDTGLKLHKQTLELIYEIKF